MTHKIKVQMFGNFRMDYNGAPFVAEKMHKESQFNRMMQALIHYSDCGIAKDKLEEIVIGERDIDAPHTALRVIVYKTKQKLAQLGLPGKNLVYLEGGIYYWTPDIEIEEDAAEFEKLQRYIDGKKRIGKRKIKRIVNQCQKLSVESEEMNRKKSLQYDQVLQRQRDLIYATRKKLLDGASVEQEKIVEIAKGNISDFVNHFDCIQSNNKHGRRRGRKKDNDKNTNTQQYTSMLNRYILDNISYKLDAGLTLSDMQSAATVSDYLMLRVYQGLSRQRERIGDEEAYEQFVREATLKAVDDGWVELIDYLEQLKYAVAGRASAQRNVMFEYQNEAFESFLDTEKAVKCNIIRNILLSDVKIGKDGRLQVIYP